jgi:hypothetical protein
MAAAVEGREMVSVGEIPIPEIRRVDEGGRFAIDRLHPLAGQSLRPNPRPYPLTMVGEVLGETPVTVVRVNVPDSQEERPLGRPSLPVPGEEFPVPVGAARPIQARRPHRKRVAVA